MASPNSAISEIAVMTLEGYSGIIADNITAHNALLRQINTKGNKYTATGRDIVQEIEFAVNSTVQFFSGAEVFDISPSETFTAAIFNYKQMVGVATINGLEEIQNSGKEAIHNFMKSKMRNLDKSLRNQVATSLYADGTGTNGKEIGGLQLLVADVNTNTVGGVPAATQTWWKNYVYGFAANSVTASSTTIQHAMNTAWINTIRGSDKADMILFDKIFYMYYWESLTAQQRFTDDKGAGAGFENIVYRGNTPVIYDDQCPASHGYFLNTDYLFLRPAKGKEFKSLGDRAPVNQDAVVMPVTWAGNMTTNGRKFQAVITL